MIIWSHLRRKARAVRLCGYLLLTSLACAALAVETQALPLLFRPATDPGCRLEMTATIGEDSVGAESLGEPHRAPGAGGKGRGNKVSVRAHVENIKAFGAHGTFGQASYLPDFLGYLWTVWVSSDNWEFLWGEIAFALTYNDRSSFHLDFVWRDGYERSTREYYGAVEKFNQRIPPRFVPADPIRAGMPVTFHLLRSSTPRGQGSLTFFGSETGEPPYREVTVPYRVKPGAGDCTVVAGKPLVDVGAAVDWALTR